MSYDLFFFLHKKDRGRPNVKGLDTLLLKKFKKKKKKGLDT